MSESSGGQALKEAKVSENQIQVRLLFESTDYTLRQLTARLESVQALMDLLLQPKAVLNPGRTRRSQMDVGNKARRMTVRRIVRATSKGYRITRHIQRSAGHGLRNTVDTRPQIRVETVSLHSPLEIVTTISATAAAIGTVIALLPKMINVKNKWNDSRVVRADANLKIEQLKLEQAVVKLVASEVEKIELDTYFALPDDHPSKKIVKRSIKALSALDKAEVRR